MIRHFSIGNSCGKPILVLGLTVLSLLVFGQTAIAIPRFALQSGMACASCHVSAGGGAMRNEGGWSVARRESLFDPGRTFLSPLYAAEDNTLFSEHISWGFDVRNQIAKRPDPETHELTRQSFFMQIAPYVSYRPAEHVEIMATYNIVKPEFAGQKEFMAIARCIVTDALAVEAGFFQPDFGVRHDDHTTFTRSAAGFVPFQADLGAQVYIHATDWLTLSGGVFDAHNRRESIGFLKEKSLMEVAKASVVITDYDAGISLSGGASGLFQNGQTLMAMQAGIGLIDRAAMQFEYVRADHMLGPESPAVNIFEVTASCNIVDGFALTGRYEQTLTDNSLGESLTRKQFVLGAQIFVLPFVELRPEYRWYDDPVRRTAQYTGQIHIFF